MVFPERNTVICKMTYLSFMTRNALRRQKWILMTSIASFSFSKKGDTALTARETIDCFRPTLPGRIISYFWVMALPAKSPGTLYAQITFSGDTWNQKCRGTILARMGSWKSKSGTQLGLLTKVCCEKLMLILFFGPCIFIIEGRTDQRNAQINFSLINLLLFKLLRHVSATQLEPSSGSLKSLQVTSHCNLLGY